jgi:hypothetical protein
MIYKPKKIHYVILAKKILLETNLKKILIVKYQIKNTLKN